MSVSITFDPSVVLSQQERTQAGIRQLVGAGMDADEARATLDGLAAPYGSYAHGRAVQRLTRAGAIGYQAMAAYGRNVRRRRQELADAADDAQAS